MAKKDAIIAYRQKASEAPRCETVFERQAVAFGYEFRDKEVTELKDAIMGLSNDMHVHSSRPCGTCRVISESIGEPFGCYAYQERRKEVIAT